LTAAFKAPAEAAAAEAPPSGPAAAALPPLAVTRLSVTAFRSYASARLDGAATLMVLTGPNGAGKTNLLEALSFLAPGRGLRRATLGDLTRRDGGAMQDAGPAPWAVAARLITPQGPVAIGTGLDPDAPAGTLRRAVRIDGQPADSQAALGRHVAMVWLTPQMDRLFIEGAGNRRRFLDRLVYGFVPEHLAALAAYEQAMRERNRLLKLGRQDDRWLAALEDGMAGHAVAIAAARRQVLARLAQAARAAADPAFPAADLALDGTLEMALDGAPALSVEDDFRASLAKRRAIDAAAGATTEGPHRSDLTVIHRAKAMPAADCSTGEQKALLIGIVLANARLAAADRGAPPILLLDEVAAHLDAERRASLFDTLAGLGGQAWLTGTDRALFAPLEGRARFVAVADGRLHPDGPDPI
jgi:DNA replication and repair protein RecF